MSLPHHKIVPTENAPFAYERGLTAVM